MKVFKKIKYVLNKELKNNLNIFRLNLCITVLLSSAFCNNFTYSQSKKEQIYELTNKNDSLLNELKSINSKLIKLKNKYDSLITLNRNSEKYNSELLSLNKNLTLQNNTKLLRLDSIDRYKNNCLHNLQNIYFNPKLYKIDTIYQNVLIGNRIFKTVIFSENFDKFGKYNPDNDWSIKNVVIFDAKTEEIVFKKRFEFDEGLNSLFSLHKLNKSLNTEGKLFLDWIGSGGGSGYKITTYLIDINENEVEFQELFISGELSHILFLNDQFIKITGIWSLDEKETHFDAHRCEISFYEDFGRTLTKKIKTKLKYDLWETNSIDAIKTIYNNEPSIFNQISNFQTNNLYTPYETNFHSEY